ncbi:MAG: META domain-containing protein [Chloroflexota bacterium]
MPKRSIGALVVLVALLAACSAGPGTGGELQSTKWILRSYDQAGTLTIVPDTQYADAEFGANRISGFSGCNTYDGRYRSGGRTLFVSQPASTKMACPEEAMTFEQRYLELLDSSRFYSVRRDTMTVFSAVGSTVLVFDAAPRNPVLGKWQVGGYESVPSTQSAPLPGTEMDVTFGIGSVGGFSGCNSFSGVYGTNGNVVRIGRLATTRLACPEDVMAQETAFLKALEGAALIETRNDQVNLTDLRGSLKVALLRPTPETIPSASPGERPSAPPASEPASEAPTAGPTTAPTPTAAATPPPTARPTAPPATPSVPPPSQPASIPPTAAICELKAPTAATVARITYPGSWHTVTDPANLVCQYFDPNPITVPADPATLSTAIRASSTETAYGDAVTAATDPAAWVVQAQTPATLDNLEATVIAETSAADAAGVAAGTARYVFIINVGSAGTVSMWTDGAGGDPLFKANVALLSLMVASSAFQAGA